jgi:hypothetical protein
MGGLHCAASGGDFLGREKIIAPPFPRLWIRLADEILRTDNEIRRT